MDNPIPPTDTVYEQDGQKYLMYMAGQRAATATTRTETTNDWQDHTNPPSKCDPGDSRGEDGSGFQEKCDKDGKWVEDLDAEKQISAINDHRRKLAFALISRVLTPAELSEVEAYGAQLLVTNGEAYREEDIRIEFQDAMYQQFKMRGWAEEAKREPKPCGTN